MKRYMVDKSALEYNIKLLLEKAKGKTLWGVIKGDGYGLGLYIVKTIVCAHNEDISVTSAEGKTSFTFTLPLET